jgi:hypothetical protein
MAEPIRRSQSETHQSAAGTASEAAYATDVLLIADEPRRTARRSSGRHPTAVRGPESIEPFDMETVVRKLIAVLHEESES